MKIQKELKNLDESNVELTVTVSKKDAKTKYDEILNKYTKEAQLPGFRKGKVPAAVLQRKYGEGIKMEAASEVIEESLKELFDEFDRYSKPLAYKQPELVGEIDFNPEKDFLFSVKYDVFPKVEFKKIEGFTIEVPKVSGEDEALSESLKEVQLRNSFVKDKPDSEVAEKDNVATINYCELDENDATIAGTEREDFSFPIGSEHNLYKIDDDIIGMKKGEEKIIKKSFDKDFSDPSLAGRDVKIKVKLTALKYRELPDLDDELAQDVSPKYKTLDDLKDSLSKQIKVSVENKILSLKKEAFFDKVLEENEFRLPQSMIDAELNSRWNNFASQVGLTPQQLEETISKGGDEFNKNVFFNSNRKESERALKERVVIETLLEEKKPEVSDDEIENEYKKLAESSNSTIEEIKEQYSKLHYEEYFKETVKESKLIKELLEKCTIKEGKAISVKELFER
ncbi:MAG: trigger factor [Treponema sp.]|nr:MAG: trigger factor [Treponema sp.]